MTSRAVVLAFVATSLLAGGGACGNGSEEPRDAGVDPYETNFGCISSDGECATTGDDILKEKFEVCENRFPTTALGTLHGCNWGEQCCLQKRCGENLTGKCTFNVDLCNEQVPGACGSEGAVCCLSQRDGPRVGAEAGRSQ